MRLVPSLLLLALLALAGAPPTHAYTFDLGGNWLSATDGTGRALVSVYDALARLSTLTDGSAVSRYAYDLGGNVVARTLPDGEAVANVYDGLGRLYSEQDTAPTGLLSQAAYRYDLGGSLCQSREYAAALRPQQRVVTLGYDLAERLTSEAVTAPDGTAIRTTGYGYDAAGNRTTRTVAGGTGGPVPVTTSYSFNEVNALTGWSDTAGHGATYGYDANGNRVSRTEDAAASTYGFDAENRLVSLNQAGVSYAYAYDYRTRRVERTEGAVSTAVVFSGGTSIAEYPGAAAAGAGAGVGSPSVEFIRGSDWGGGVGGILYSVRGANTSFDHYDDLLSHSKIQIHCSPDLFAASEATVRLHFMCFVCCRVAEMNLSITVVGSPRRSLPCSGRTWRRPDGVFASWTSAARGR